MSQNGDFEEFLYKITYLEWQWKFNYEFFFDKNNKEGMGKLAALWWKWMKFKEIQLKLLSNPNFKQESMLFLHPISFWMEQSSCSVFTLSIELQLKNNWMIRVYLCDTSFSIIDFFHFSVDLCCVVDVCPTSIAGFIHYRLFCTCITVIPLKILFSFETKPVCHETQYNGSFCDVFAHSLYIVHGKIDIAAIGKHVNKQNRTKRKG